MDEYNLFYDQITTEVKIIHLINIICTIFHIDVISINTKMDIMICLLNKLNAIFM